MASPDPQLYPFLVRRQHGHGDRLDLALQPALPVQRVKDHRDRRLLSQYLVVWRVYDCYLVSTARSCRYDLESY